MDYAIKKTKKVSPVQTGNKTFTGRDKFLTDWTEKTFSSGHNDFKIIFDEECEKLKEKDE